MPSNPEYCFNTIAGRYVVVCFFHSAAEPGSRQVLNEIVQGQQRFDDTNACFFGVSTDVDDEKKPRVKAIFPGIRYFWDFDYEISREFAAVNDHEGGTTCRRLTYVLDTRLRVIAVFPCTQGFRGVANGTANTGL